MRAAAVTGLLAPVIAIATPGADAELLDLCRLLDDDSRTLQHNETMDITGWTQADQDEADDLMWRLHDTIEARAAIPATTLAGIQAKAVATGHALKQGIIVDLTLSFDEQAEDYTRLAMSLVRDLVGGHA
jgi:hypothetical protein